MGLVLALGMRSGLFETRYLIVGLPGLLLLSALGIVRIAHWPVLVPVLLACVALVPAYFGLSAQYFDPSLARDDYRDLVATIINEAQPSDAILLVAARPDRAFSTTTTTAICRPSACRRSGRSTPTTRVRAWMRFGRSTGASGWCRGR